MSDVSGVNAASSVTYDELDPAQLSPDALLAYCSSRLNSLDDMIKTRMAQQSDATNKAKQAGNFMSLLQTWTTVTDHAQGPNVKEGHQGMAAGIIDQFNATQDPQLQTAMRNTYKAVTGLDMNVGPDGKAVTYAKPSDIPLNTDNIHGMTAEQWQSTMIEPVKTIQDNISKGSDLAMIAIQSMISQRQQAVQLTTQMMQAINDGTKSVVSNVGH